MIREQRITLVEEVTKQENAFDKLEKELETISQETLSIELLNCGIIPERYKHDSSEEKLWAKYCDIVLSIAFNFIGIESQVLRARGDSADVFGKTNDYSIVADAKAFRLSRTAKNQKDFKVSALDDWRREDTYACLVSPLYQYPTRTSQIYKQAEEKNVTLLSYVHLKFLLDYPPQQSLESLWTTPAQLSPSKDARRYWESIDDAVVATTNKSYQDLRDYKQLEIDTAKQVGKEGISYWQEVIESYHQLPRDKAIKRLIKAEKIEQKIDVIQKAIDKVSRSLDG
jgi:hypothetical protein